MKFSIISRLFLLILLIFITFYSVSWHRKSGGEILGGGMENDTSRLQAVFSKTKTVCFGRLVIEIPFEAEISYGPAEVDYSIEYRKGEADKLDEHLSSRIKKIELEREILDADDLARLPLFGKVMNGVRPNQKIIIGSDDRVGYTVLSLLPIHEDLFMQSVYGELPQYDIVERMNKVAEILRIRSAAEIPPDPGMCIEGGFVPGVYEYERATIGVRFKEFPDVHLSVDVHKNLEFLHEDGNPKTLHERARRNAEDAGLGAVFSKGRVLREQIRQVGHWSGQELIIRTPAYKRAASVHEFRFHSVGAVNDPFHPQLDIRLDSGVKNNAKGAISPSITDDEALALWDMLIKTIRLREPGDATPARTEKAAIATRVGSGETCPETGWWEAAEERVAKDQRRRFLRAGDRMPDAITSPAPGAWAKIFGAGPLKVATTWTFVAHDDGSHPVQASEANGSAVIGNSAGGQHG